MCYQEKVFDDVDWQAVQDSLAGYVRPDELEGTENEDNVYFGMAKSFVFLQIWLEDLRGWIPSQGDLKPAWDGHMIGTDDDFEIVMADDSKVCVHRSKQLMEAVSQAGEVLATFSVGREGDE
ncbi:hypothetical protein [Neisseria sp. HMSC061B04]|uniref:hypothetical protein n=1 Tax=Neisseria sp. HMSC061B04 TaxID=1715140 RepID=UPI0008A902C6|nr:hypothetical protein [Neisseria sp. HMSC061B04]OHP52411.1 hypothetical protein HMPREF2661_02300 [Neisseria sp. HMSC061B04]